MPTVCFRATTKFARLPLASAAALVIAATTAPALAEVHFGNNVFIGGHNFSHQTFSRRHRAVVTLYDHPIRGGGCVTRPDGRNGTVKRCRLQTIRH